MSCAGVITSRALANGSAGPIAPVASFTMGATSGYVGLPLALSDTSLHNPTSWSWTVNGMVFSNVQNPLFYPTVADSYTFTLTATNAFGSNTSSGQTYIANNY